MKALLHLALAAPITLALILTSYRLLLSPSSTLPLRLAALVLTLLTARLLTSLIQNILYTRRAASLGCGEIPTLPHRDPILGLDTFAATLSAHRASRLMPFYQSLFQKHGHTFYTPALGTSVLMTDEPANIQAILATKFDDWPIAGPRLWAALPVLGPLSIFASNGHTWRAARAVLRPSFMRDQVVADGLRCFDRHVRNLLAAVPVSTDRTKPVVDLQLLFQKMTMDSSTDFLLGHSTDSQLSADPSALRFLADFDYASNESAKLSRLGPLLFYLPHSKLRQATARVRAYIRFYIQKVVAERARDKAEGREPDEKKYVFLDELLRMGLPEDHVVDHVLTIVVAGRDTLAASLAAVFYLLARDPEAVRKLRAEIEAQGVEDPSWEQLRQMKYLNNVVREALRLFPPVATNGRTSNKETILPRGGGPDGNLPILVPKGTPIRYSSYCMHRRKDIYGPDAEEFRPERWETLRVEWQYTPFSGGPRICIGQQFALTQMSYTVYKFFTKFRTIEARDDGDPLQKASLTFSFARGCLVSVGV
ncbi:cytochrome P450 [Echria macrotheca]|uniref:Cytochrome P450 n=1 Tax=Echria macrotheca TaxID=438768 RepID=A0AAJ0BIA1_9PEZI|nr:cytochrome P450 [Echria macrotheca]